MIFKNNKENNWNKVYSSYISKNIKKLPWIRTKVSFWFKEVIESGWVKPSRAIDLGCGNGYYSFYLVKKGFKVLGVDISSKVISIAKNSYVSKDLKFRTLDVFSEKMPKKPFDFVLDVGLFHNIPPEKRIDYLKVIDKLTKKGSKVLIFCFDRSEQTFKNKKIYHNEVIDMYSYPLSKKEIIALFSKDFKIEEIRRLEYGTNNYKKRFLCFLEKK